MNRIVLQLGLLFALLFAHQHSLPTDRVVHVYVPPLTHTPELGLSTIGHHEHPPFTLLDVLHPHLPPPERQRLSELHQEQQTYLTKGVQQRLQMQAQTRQLIEQLPHNIVHLAWLERFQHQQSIGEIKVWSRLLEQRTTR